jgi:hypothetical protein
MIVEKNDTDISPLFTWGKEFKIFDVTGKEIKRVYLRVVGDAEINRSRVFALRKSAELRSKLRDENSDERFAFIPDKSLVDKDKLIELIIFYTTRETTRTAMKNIKIPFPKEPKSNAPLEQVEEYQKEIDEYPLKRDAAIKAQVYKINDVTRKVLQTYDIDRLYKEFESALINEICEEEMIKRFTESCAYYGSYKDPQFKERLFNSYEEFDNNPSEIKKQFVEYYTTLDLSGDYLKG